MPVPEADCAAVPDIEGFSADEDNVEVDKVVGTCDEEAVEEAAVGVAVLLVMLLADFFEDA